MPSLLRTPEIDFSRVPAQSAPLLSRTPDAFIEIAPHLRSDEELDRVSKLY